MNFISQHKTAFLALLILFITLYFISIPNDQEEDKGFLHRALMTVATPMQMAVVAVVDGVVNIWDGYFALVDAKNEADDLRNAKFYMGQLLKQQLVIEQENARLRRLLEFKQRIPLSYVPGRIIASDILGQFRTVTINVGQKDGVRKGYPVINDSGVIGRIIEVYPGFAKVLLMIDPNSSIDGRVKRTMAKGIIQGTRDNEKMFCQFAFSLRTEDVQAGDQIITSGLDQSFPEGLVLGEIVEVSKTEVGIFQEAYIKPAVDFTRIFEVLVITSGTIKP